MKYIRYTLREAAGGEKIIIPMPESYKDCFTLIQSDQYRKVGRILPIWRIWVKTLINPTNCAFFWMRMREHKQGWFHKFASLITYYYNIMAFILIQTISVLDCTISRHSTVE